jgi:hypothetical protein
VFRDLRQRDAGTLFSLFVQSPFDRDNPVPETIEVSSPAGSLGMGPSDQRMYVVSPIGKQSPYGLTTGPYGTPWLFLPPWRGPVDPPVEPGEDGHFDHLRPGTTEFEAAHLFGTVRAVLDIWEGYIGQPVPWHFERDFARLELGLLPWWENGQMGYGYLEIGSDWQTTGRRHPFALDFDVVAHEVGHGIIYSQIGLPELGGETGEFLGFHESTADWVAMIASINFDSVIDELLTTTRGNLYTFNHFNRFAALSPTKQIRLASNSIKLGDFADGWSDEHELSEPLTGCVFDIFVDLFHDILHEVGAVPRGADELFHIAENAPQRAADIQGEFDRIFSRSPDAFYAAFVDARDTVARLLAATWQQLSGNDLLYSDVETAMIAADRQMTGGQLRHILSSNFRWRQIGLVEVGPKQEPSGPESHIYSSRIARPEHRNALPRMSYHERYLIACQHCNRSRGSRPSISSRFG